MGCPASGNCDERFIRGVAVDAQPSAFYLEFDPSRTGWCSEALPLREKSPWRSAATGSPIPHSARRTSCR